MAGNKRTEIKLTAYDDLFETDQSREEAKLSKIRDIPISEISDLLGDVELHQIGVGSNKRFLKTLLRNDAGDLLDGTLAMVGNCIEYKTIDSHSSYRQIIVFLSSYNVHRNIENLCDFQNGIDMAAHSGGHVVGGACLTPAVAELPRSAGKAGTHVGIAEGEDGAFLIDAFGNHKLEVTVFVLGNAKIWTIPRITDNRKKRPPVVD